MANNDPERTVVKPLVIDDIYWTMKKFGRPKKAYTKADLMKDENEKIGLGSHLRIPVAIRESMATPYTKHSKEEFGGSRVTRKEARKAASIKSSIDLVHKKANEKQ